MLQFQSRSISARLVRKYLRFQVGQLQFDKEKGVLAEQLTGVRKHARAPGSPRLFWMKRDANTFRMIDSC